LLEKSADFINSYNGDSNKLNSIFVQWKELLGENFDLAPERFVYRDDYKKSEGSQDFNHFNSEKEFDEIFSILQDLIPQLQAIYFSQSKVSVKKVFRSLGQSSIPLLTFYAHYHRLQGIDLEEESLAFKQKTEEIRKLARQVLEKNKSSDIINITLVDIKNIFTDQPKSKNHFWIGGLMQIGEGKPYLRNTFPGHGKMMARFIQDEKVVETINKWNSSNPEMLNIDHGDNSAFNANLHPELTAYKIESLYPHHGTSNDLNPTLSDLEIRQMGDDVVLWSEKLQKICKPINYGLEGLERRSPLYQLIQNFGPKVLDIELLRQLLRPVIAQQKSWGEFLPRITLVNKMVIQRKQWNLKFKQLANGDQDFWNDISSKNFPLDKADLYYQIISFFNKEGIPTNAFFKLKNSQSNSKRPKKEFRKPQFLNIVEPAHFLRFLHLLKMEADEIMIEEIYPKPMQEGAFAGHCQEWVVEFDME